MTDSNLSPYEAVGPKATDLAPYVQAVDNQRERLIQSIAEFDSESRQELLRLAEKGAWFVFSGIAVAGAGYVASTLLKRTFGPRFNQVPVSQPVVAPVAGPSLAQTIGWTLVSGVGIGLATVLARKGATKTWVALTGAEPMEFDGTEL